MTPSKELYILLPSWPFNGARLMMPHYVVLLFSPTDPLQLQHVELRVRRFLESQRGWNYHLVCSGMCALYKSDELGGAQTCILPNRLGIVFGRVFTKPTPDAPCQRDTLLDEETAQEIVNSHGNFLLKERWGQYAAFLTDRSAHRQHVVRDPSGAVRCYLLARGGLLACFSHVEDLGSLGFSAPLINWRYVAGFLLHSRLQIQETGFDGINELHAGARLTHSNSLHSVECAWTPNDVIRNNPVLGFDQARNSVALALGRCTDSMTDNYRRVVHRLSGGLDSAVVLDALLQSPSRPLLFCENHYADSAPEGDERTYARMVSKALGASLREIEFPRNASNLNRLENLPITARPSASLLSFQHEFILTLAREHGIDAFTNGHGGDQVFCNYSGPLLAADYVMEKGIDSGLVDLIRGIAGNGQHSLWKILAAIIRCAYAGVRDDPMLQHRDVNNPLTDEASESVTLDYITPTWISQCRDLPPAKLMHVLMIADLQVYNEMSIENVVADTPTLLAVQPIVEICLQTPTHILGHRGADRAVERAAFAARLPFAIVNRHRKGDTTRYFANLLLANLQWLRPFLLDGSVLQSGLVCRSKLERLLTTESLVRGNCFGALISCLLAEAWVGSARRLVPGASA